MPLRILMRYLLNNEQLVQKIAESYPVRRAAQLTAYMMHRGKAIGEETVEKIHESQVIDRARDEAKNAGKRAQVFQETFMKEIKDGFKELNQEIKQPKK